MDAAVAEPPNPAVGYVGRSIEERVSLLEGTVTNQDRIFDMLSEGQQNLRGDITGLRAETRTGLRELRDDMDKRFDEMDKRFGEMDARISETNERITAMEHGVNERITAMEHGVNERIVDMGARVTDMDVRLNTKIDSNLKWILGVQIAMWVTIIVAVLL
ncbi:MAG: hypothetical protein C5S47_05865 [Candidatus Methanogasteraceae archaeon]|nr:MAG: hypothetical protein C5S47_05865 [ANME-2 cluster archaeon]